MIGAAIKSILKARNGGKTEVAEESFEESEEEWEMDNVHGGGHH